MFKWLTNLFKKKDSISVDIKAGDSRILTTVDNKNIYWNGAKMWYISGMTIDADGSPRAYHPQDIGIDYLKYAGGKNSEGGWVWWGIAVDKNGKPFIQTDSDPCPGYYVSTTAYSRIEYPLHDPRRYVDSEKIPYIVIPAHVKRMVPPKFLGCLCKVTNLSNRKQCVAVLADFGPRHHLGEGSIALAKQLGIESNPKTGGTHSNEVLYEIFPGTPAKVGNEQFRL